MPKKANSLSTKGHSAGCINSQSTSLCQMPFKPRASDDRCRDSDRPNCTEDSRAVRLANKPRFWHIGLAFGYGLNNFA